MSSPSPIVRVAVFVGRHPWWSALLVVIIASMPAAIPYVGGVLAAVIVVAGAAGIAFANHTVRNASRLPAHTTPALGNGPAQQEVYRLPAVPPVNRWEPTPPAPRQAAVEQFTETPNLEALVSQLEYFDPPCLDEQIEVAGETYYIKGIRRVFGQRNARISDRGTTLENCECVLVPEPWNPYDPNAVAVMVDGHQVGHVPADLAADYARPLRERAAAGRLMGGSARIWAKSDSGIVRARVTVLTASAESLVD